MMAVTGKSTHYLDFLRELTVGLLTIHGTAPSLTRAVVIPPVIRDQMR
jgi:hypothetical protein